MTQAGFWVVAALSRYTSRVPSLRGWSAGKSSRRRSAGNGSRGSAILARFERRVRPARARARPLAQQPAVGQRGHVARPEPIAEQQARQQEIDHVGVAAANAARGAQDDAAAAMAEQQ